MRQATFAESGFAKFHRATRKDRFLAQMEELIPWRELCAAIGPHYPRPQGAGRRPVGVERMLRIHLMQHGFNLSDPAMEDALYDSAALRRFAGIDLGNERAPDETTICKFRHLMERKGLGERLFGLVNAYRVENGLTVSRGTIVDASIMAAPSSTKNRAKARDPEMRSTRKGNQWYFGMKAHIGMDSRTKLIHSVAATPANVQDSQVLPALLHSGETRVWGDRGEAARLRVGLVTPTLGGQFVQQPLGKTSSEDAEIPATVDKGAEARAEELLEHKELAPGHLLAADANLRS